MMSTNLEFGGQNTDVLLKKMHRINFIYAERHKLSVKYIRILIDNKHRNINNLACIPC